MVPNLASAGVTDESTIEAQVQKTFHPNECGENDLGAMRPLVFELGKYGRTVV